MEIFVDASKMHKIKWLGSLPLKFKQQIVDTYADQGVQLTEQGRYQAIMSFDKPRLMQNSCKHKESITDKLLLKCNNSSLASSHALFLQL